MSNTVLVASLFPNPFLHASKRAALLAVGFNCRKIEFLSVIKSGEKRNSPPPISSRQSEEDMDSLARSMVEVKTESAAATILYGMCSSARFDFGGLHESACKRANEIAPTLIVIGWQSHPWWPVLHNFNLIHGISRSSLKPVLLVRREPRKSYSHAVFLWDESSALPDMLEVMARLLPYARITIVHAYHLPGGADAHSRRKEWRYRHGSGWSRRRYKTRLCADTGRIRNRPVEILAHIVAKACRRICCALCRDHRRGFIDPVRPPALARRRMVLAVQDARPDVEKLLLTS